MWIPYTKWHLVHKRVPQEPKQWDQTMHLSTYLNKIARGYLVLHDQRFGVAGRPRTWSALPTPQFLGNGTELNSGTYRKFQHNAREWDTTSCRGDAGEAESMLPIWCTYAVPKPQTTPTHCSQVLQGDGEGNNYTGAVLNAHLHLVLHSTEV